MYARRILMAFVFFALAAPSVSAMTSHDLLIPVVSRGPGAQGSLWRTDVFITNHGISDAQVLVNFFSGGGSVLIRNASLSPRQTLVLRDFGAQEIPASSWIGLVRATAPAGSRLGGYAKIVNSGGPVGPFGQTVPGIPADSLRKEHLLAGVQSINPERTNVGISNPWAIEVPVSLGIVEASGNLRSSFTTVVPPRSVLQLNDVKEFSTGEPLQDATIRVTSQIPLYAYASVVRSDSGDPTFVGGTGVASGNDLLLPVSCANPAPVVLVEPGQTEAPGWIVYFRNDVDASLRSAQLAAVHGFTLSQVYEHAFKGFAAVFSSEVLRNLRCEPDVEKIFQNQGGVF